MAESKRTPERVEAICALLRTGTTRKAAANASGIHEDTFYEWMKDSEFSESVKSAEAEVENEMASLVQVAARDTWQAAAWWLERRRNQDYAKREKQDVEGGLAIEVTYVNKDQSSD